MKNLQTKIIIAVLLIIPILILYFNINPFNLFSFDDIKENYENNFMNICKNKPTNFYDIDTNNNNSKKTYTLNSKNRNNCKQKCSKDKCDLYTLYDLDNNKVKCETYNLDNGNQLNSAKINCSNNKLSNASSSLYNTYNGKGYMNKDYYKTNSDKLEYIDYELDKTNEIISKYHSINNEINNLKGTYNNRGDLIQMYNDVNLDAKELADYLDLSKNMIYSNFVPNEYAVDINKDFRLGDKNMSYDEMMKYMNSLTSENKFLNTKENITKDNFEYKFSFYLALVIILIISTIIIILYKVSDSISELFLIGYFSFVTLALFILHYFVKI